MEDIERAVLRGKMGRITSSNVDPVWLAGELLAAGIIGDIDFQRASNSGELLDRRLGELVQKVMKNGAPDVFLTFVSILLKESHVKWLGEELKADFIRVGGVWKKDGPPRQRFNTDDGSQSKETQSGITSDGLFDYFKKNRPDTQLFLPYPINKKGHGLALIIVNKTFKPHPDHLDKKPLSTRDCADRDESNLRDLWTHLGYRIRVEKDKTADQIESIFEEIRADRDIDNTIQQGDDSFVCCISSHGTWDSERGVDVVYGVEGVQIEKDCLVIKEEAVNIEASETDMVLNVKKDQVEKVHQVTAKGAVDIKCLAYRTLSSLNCPKLKGRPKLFFIQACRGKRYPMIDDDESTGKKNMFTPPKHLVQETDFLFAYATAPQCKAFRNDGAASHPIGSFFITHLHQCLKNYAHKLPLVPILEAVSQQHALEDPYDIQKDGDKVTTRQSPNFSSSFRGPVFFFDDACEQYKKIIPTVPKN